MTTDILTCKKEGIVSDDEKYTENVVAFAGNGCISWRIERREGRSCVRRRKYYWQGEGLI